MKKTAAIGATIFLLGLSAVFSFAEASTLYLQPAATTVISNSYDHYILRMCIPVSSASSLGTIFFAPGPGVSTTTTSWAVYVSKATDSLCTTGVTLLANPGIGSLEPSLIQSYTFSTTSPISLSGVHYLRIEIFDGGGGAVPITDQALGTTGFFSNADINNNPYLKLTDAINNSINWTDLEVVPPIDFGAVQFVATSTSFFSGDASGSLQALADECSTTGNIFSNALCRAFAYLFVPNPTVLDQYQNLGPQLQTKFPVSWVYQVQAEINTAATTTLSSPVWTMNLHDAGIGSTTPLGNILPNMVVFSSSTVKRYISDAQWNALMTLAGAAIWLVAFYTLYAIGHRLFTGHRQVV